MNVLGFTIDSVRVSANGFECPQDKQRFADPSLEQIEICRAWLREHVRPTKTIRPRHSSYGLKHTVEEWTRRCLGGVEYTYVSNGSFIVAAALEGFALERIHWRSPNARFAFTLKKQAKPESLESRRAELRLVTRLDDAAATAMHPREWGSPPVREDVMRLLRARVAAAENERRRPRRGAA